MDKSKYNTKCGLCGFDAYAGLQKLECSNRTCKFYKKPEKDDETKVINKEDLPASSQYSGDPHCNDGSHYDHDCPSCPGDGIFILLVNGQWYDCGLDMSKR